MQHKKYIIIGPPIPWKRAGRNKNLYYDAQKLQKEKIAWELKLQHGNNPLFKQPIRIDYHFYFEIPKTKSKTILPNSWFTKVPDKTNIEKFYEDAAKGILFKDDCGIVCGYQEKRYNDGQGVRVEIEVWELK